MQANQSPNTTKGHVGKWKLTREDPVRRRPYIRSFPRDGWSEHGCEIHCVSWAKEGEGTKFLEQVYEFGSCKEGNRIWALLAHSRNPRIGSTVLEIFKNII